MFDTMPRSVLIHTPRVTTRRLPPMATPRPSPADKAVKPVDAPQAPKAPPKTKRGKGAPLPITVDPDGVKTTLNPEVAWPFPTGPQG